MPVAISKYLIRYQENVKISFPLTSFFYRLFFTNKGGIVSNSGALLMLLLLLISYSIAQYKESILTI